jgi:glycosyltransferase involved in cell wall biosynthesis
MNPVPIPVLLLIRELGIGGTERQLVETARYLPRDRFTPYVGCFRPEGPRREDLERAGVPILHLKMHSFLSPAVFSAASQLAGFVREKNIRVVHSFDAPLNIFSVPVAKFAGVPAVLSSQRGDRELTGRLTHQCLRVTDRLTDAVVVNCDAMRKYLTNCEGTAPGKIRVCHNAVDVQQYSRQPVESRWPGKTVIGVVCALRPEKQLDSLLHAFSKLGRSDAQLLIVGGGLEESRLKTLAADLQLGAACHFEPATGDVVPWLSMIDIFVLPSRTEALSNSLMEAMACSCCAVATRVGGNPELIDDGVNGLLFEAGDVDQLREQLETLLDNPGRRRAMVEEGAAKMKACFTFSHAAQTMGDIYESVLAR